MPQACVFTPVPMLTVTVEEADTGTELHLHAGGQGFWIARLLAELGVDVTLCATFGGETGRVVRCLLADEEPRGSRGPLCVVQWWLRARPVRHA